MSFFDNTMNNSYNNHHEILTHTYDMISNKIITHDDVIKHLNNNELLDLNNIINFSEKAKAVLTVIITSLTHKIFNNSQDIRIHQSKLKNGYSGRTIDTKYITPFLKEYSLPHMAESGWLTRSLEQGLPYNLNYPGQIKPSHLKSSFLTLLHNIEEENKNPSVYLSYILLKLIEDRRKKEIVLAKPKNLNINQIEKILYEHFHTYYDTFGASRLPVLAVYAAYQCWTQQLKKYQNKLLLPLANHNSADKQTGLIGDIQINDINSEIFEAFEIKHNIQISKQTVVDAYEKFKTKPVQKYYLLSTMDSEVDHTMQRELIKINKLHGCEVFVEDLLTHIIHILKNIEDTYQFIDHYVNNLMKDNTIKYEHKMMWNEIILNF